MRDNGLMTRRGLCLVVTLGVAIAVARPVGAQTPPPDPKPTPAGQATPAPAQVSAQPALPVDVDKIRTAIEKPQPLHINDQHLRFFLEVRPAPVTFMSLVGNFDLMKGAVAGSAPTGRDLATMMTPREMYSSAGITATDMLQFAATNFAAQTLIRRAVEEIRNAKDQKQVSEIRSRIDRELTALMGKDKQP